MGYPSRLNELVKFLGWSGLVQPELSWEKAIASVGHRFPNDFKRLAEVFPSGSFGNRIYLFSPIQNQQSLADYKKDSQLTLERLEMIRELVTFPYTLFPEADGLIPWASGDNELYLWHNAWGSEPDDWPVVYVDSENGDCGRYEGSVSDFLLQLLSGGIDDSPIAFGIDQSERGFRAFQRYLRNS